MPYCTVWGVCVDVEHLIFANIKKIFILFLLTVVIQVSPATILCSKRSYLIAFEIMSKDLISVGPT